MRGGNKTARQTAQAPATPSTPPTPAYERALASLSSGEQARTMGTRKRKSPFDDEAFYVISDPEDDNGTEHSRKKKKTLAPATPSRRLLPINPTSNSKNDFHVSLYEPGSLPVHLPVKLPPSCQTNGFLVEHDSVSFADLSQHVRDLIMAYHLTHMFRDSKKYQVGHIPILADDGRVTRPAIADVSKQMCIDAARHWFHHANFLIEIDLSIQHPCGIKVAADLARGKAAGKTVHLEIIVSNIKRATDYAQASFVELFC